MALASRSKRSLNSVLETLIATVRSRRVSRALYTSPMPPAPIAERISYGPSLEPEERAICAAETSLTNKNRLRNESRANRRELAPVFMQTLGRLRNAVLQKPDEREFAISSKRSQKPL